MTHELTAAEAGPGGPGDAAGRSQQRWLRERDHLNAHRHDLIRLVQPCYPQSWQVARHAAAGPAAVAAR